MQVSVHGEIEQQLIISLSERYPGLHAETKHEQDIVKGWDILQQEVSSANIAFWKHIKQWPAIDVNLYFLVFLLHSSSIVVECTATKTGTDLMDGLQWTEYRTLAVKTKESAVDWTRS